MANHSYNFTQTPCAQLVLIESFNIHIYDNHAWNNVTNAFCESRDLQNLDLFCFTYACTYIADRRAAWQVTVMLSICKSMHNKLPSQSSSVHDVPFDVTLARWWFKVYRCTHFANYKILQMNCSRLLRNIIKKCRFAEKSVLERGTCIAAIWRSHDQPHHVVELIIINSVITKTICDPLCENPVKVMFSSLNHPS